MPTAILPPPTREGDPAGPLRIEQVPVEDLRLSGYNPRTMSDAERAKLERSIAEFGMVDPIVARREDREVIGGHQRLVAARGLAMTAVPVVFLDITPERAKLLNLALNRITGDWDAQLLGALLEELDAIPDLDLSISGFDGDDIAIYRAMALAQHPAARREDFDLDAALAAAREDARPRRGEIWALGRHRLMCGDAASGEDVARLCAGERVEVVISDPPYNVGYLPAGERAGRDPAGRGALGPILNDALSPADYDGLLRAAFSNAVAAMPAGGALYLFGSSRSSSAYARAFESAGVHAAAAIVWMKESATLTWQDYRPQYELIHYGWVAGRPHAFYGDRTNTDVWQMPRDPGSEYAHPTQKPAELYQRALGNSSLPGQTMLDLFAGGGTALIAAERTGRRCLAMELDERFCEAALQRWERFTGLSARRAS